MEKIVNAVLNLIQDLGIEEEIKQALGLKAEKVKSKVVMPKVQVCANVEKLVEAVKPHLTRPQKTPNGYEIYYDESNGEAVGIVYKNLVFLKKTSSKDIDWFEAVEYCKTVVINGIQSQLCPVKEGWREEFLGVAEDLYKALQEIGAENLDDWTWCSEYDIYGNAWYQSFSDGTLDDGIKGYGRSVRPVLVLK